MDQVASYKERSNRNEVITSVGQTIEGTGGHIDVAISHATVRDTAEAAVGVQGSFRHMFTTNEQRAAALDRGFAAMQEQFLKHSGIPPEVLSLLTPIGVPSQEAVVCFGRICCDVSDAKLDKAGILLEGSRLEGGHRVKLVLNELPSFSLFPGQYVLVEGLNPSGNRMVVKRLCEGVPRPLCAPEARAGGQGALHVMVSAGPFSCSDDLDYEPLRDLLFLASKRDPVDVLVLVGPFVDAGHPQVAKGLMEYVTVDGVTLVDPWTLFSIKVSGLLEAMYADQPSLALQVVLVPALADVMHDHVFPQPPLADRVPGGAPSPFFPDEKLYRLDIPLADPAPSRASAGSASSSAGSARQAIHTVGNPSLLLINGVSIGVSATDILMHLSKEEISHNPTTSNRLDRLASHLVEQQSLYPLFPVTGADAPPLDMRYAEKLRLPFSPDILVTPSRLTHFARRLKNGTFALNPGQLAKGVSGGTYARISVGPSPPAAAAAASAGTGAPELADRISVQIKRI